MDVREKLVEQAISHFWYGVSHDIFSEPVTTYAKLAIEALKKENGVTVQEWISVEEHLPQENEPEGAICEQVQVLLDNGVVSTGWCNRRTKLWWHLNYGETYFTGCDYEHTPVIAWQPFAQPPKGE